MEQIQEEVWYKRARDRIINEPHSFFFVQDAPQVLDPVGQFVVVIKEGYVRQQQELDNQSNSKHGSVQSEPLPWLSFMRTYNNCILHSQARHHYDSTHLFSVPVCFSVIEHCKIIGASYYSRKPTKDRNEEDATAWSGLFVRLTLQRCSYDVADFNAGRLGSDSLQLLPLTTVIDCHMDIQTPDFIIPRQRYMEVVYTKVWKPGDRFRQQWNVDGEHTWFSGKIVAQHDRECPWERYKVIWDDPDYDEDDQEYFVNAWEMYPLEFGPPLPPAEDDEVLMWASASLSESSAHEDGTHTVCLSSDDEAGLPFEMDERDSDDGTEDDMYCNSEEEDALYPDPNSRQARRRRRSKRRKLGRRRAYTDKYPTTVPQLPRPEGLKGQHSSLCQTPGSWPQDLRDQWRGLGVGGGGREVLGSPERRSCRSSRGKRRSYSPTAGNHKETALRRSTRGQQAAPEGLQSLSMLPSGRHCTSTEPGVVEGSKSDCRCCGSSASTSGRMHQCSIPLCGARYHVSCLCKLSAYLKLEFRDAEEALVPSKGQSSTNSRPYIQCPRHFCQGCHRPGQTAQMVACTSCIRTYHSECAFMKSHSQGSLNARCGHCAHARSASSKDRERLSLVYPVPRVPVLSTHPGASFFQLVRLNSQEVPRPLVGKSVWLFGTLGSGADWEVGGATETSAAPRPQIHSRLVVEPLGRVTFQSDSKTTPAFRPRVNGVPIREARIELDPQNVLEIHGSFFQLQLAFPPITQAAPNSLRPPVMVPRPVGRPRMKGLGPLGRGPNSIPRSVPSVQVPLGTPECVSIIRPSLLVGSRSWREQVPIHGPLAQMGDLSTTVGSRPLAQNPHVRSTGAALTLSQNPKASSTLGAPTLPQKPKVSSTLGASTMLDYAMAPLYIPSGKSVGYQSSMRMPVASMCPSTFPALDQQLYQRLVTPPSTPPLVDSLNEYPIIRRGDRMDMAPLNGHQNIGPENESRLHKTAGLSFQTVSTVLPYKSFSVEKPPALTPPRVDTLNTYPIIRTNDRQATEVGQNAGTASLLHAQNTGPVNDLSMHKLDGTIVQTAEAVLLSGSHNLGFGNTPASTHPLPRPLLPAKLCPLQSQLQHTKECLKTPEINVYLPLKNDLHLQTLPKDVFSSSSAAQQVGSPLLLSSPPVPPVSSPSPPECKKVDDKQYMTPRDSPLQSSVPQLLDSPSVLKQANGGQQTIRSQPPLLSSIAPQLDSQSMHLPVQAQASTLPSVTGCHALVPTLSSYGQSLQQLYALAPSFDKNGFVVGRYTTNQVQDMLTRLRSIGRAS